MPRDNPKIVRAGRGWRPPGYKPLKPPKSKPPKRPPRRTNLPPIPPMGGGNALASIFGPYESWINSQLAAEQARAKAEAFKQQALMQGYAKWYAEHIPQQIQQIYGNAANTQVGFAKGFSDGMAIAQQQAAAEANKLIGNAHAPEGQMIKPTSATADVLYGLGGFLPGSTLSTQGAAFASAASIMPGAIAAEGAKQARGILEDSSKVVESLLGKQAEVKSKKAEARVKLQEAQQKQAIDLYNEGVLTQRQLAKALGLKDWRRYPNQTKPSGLSKISASASRLTGYLVDEYGNPILDRNGKPIPIQREQSRISPTLSAGNGYLTDVYGNPITNAKGEPVPYTPYAPPSRSGGGGSSGKPYVIYANGQPMLYDPSKPLGPDNPTPMGGGAPQVSAKDIATARTLARTVVSGVRGGVDALGRPTWEVKPVRNWQVARDYLVSKGVDPATASWALWPYRSKLKGAPKKRPPNPKASAAPSGGGRKNAAFGDYVLPTQGKIIGSPYAGTHTLGNWESDNALDISVPVGTPIYAVADGVIGSQFGSLGSGGRFAGLRLHLNTGDNEFYYAHLSRFAPGIRPGVRVRRGQLIGYSGSANGVAHLHFGMRYGDPSTLYGAGRV